MELWLTIGSRFQSQPRRCAPLQYDTEPMTERKHSQSVSQIDRPRCKLCSFQRHSHRRLPGSGTHMSSLSTRSDVSQRITKFVRYTPPRHHNLARGTSTRVKQYSLGAFKKPPSLHLPTLLKNFQTTQETLQQLKHSNTMPSPPDFNEKASTQPDQPQEESTPTTADQASGPQNANIFDLQQTVVSIAPPPHQPPSQHDSPLLHTYTHPHSTETAYPTAKIGGPRSATRGPKRGPEERSRGPEDEGARTADDDAGDADASRPQQGILKTEEGPWRFRASYAWVGFGVRG